MLTAAQLLQAPVGGGGDAATAEHDTRGAHATAAMWCVQDSHQHEHTLLAFMLVVAGSVLPLELAGLHAAFPGPMIYPTDQRRPCGVLHFHEQCCCCLLVDCQLRGSQHGGTYCFKWSSTRYAWNA